MSTNEQSIWCVQGTGLPSMSATTCHLDGQVHRDADWRGVAELWLLCLSCHKSLTASARAYHKRDMVDVFSATKNKRQEPLQNARQSPDLQRAS